jgi:lipid-A-disaccharide synthase
MEDRPAMRIFISTGEPSGDLHAANLVHALRTIRPDATFEGFGGPKFQAAGATLLFPLVDHAVMWFLAVFQQIFTFIGVVRLADRHFRDHKPDVVVLIDYPGLHWWIARRAKARGVPVVYYVPPQLWAWAGWRVKKVARFFDRVLCSLPFEPDWYRKRGVTTAEFVGHPYFDELAGRPLDANFLLAHKAQGGPVMAILPGSRDKEIERNGPMLLKAAARVRAERPDVRFLVAAHKPEQARRMADLRDAAGLDRASVTIVIDRTAEVIQLADAAWAVSGSVCLELMNEALPTSIVYRVRRFDLLVARRFIVSKYITLVNLLADAELMPEHLTERDVDAEIAAWALNLLNDPQARADASTALADLRERVARPGASARAAARILDLIDPTPRSPLRGPHATTRTTKPTRESAKNERANS